jgi:hypothetical protein
MNDAKYIGLYVHLATISATVPGLIDGRLAPLRVLKIQ